MKSQILAILLLTCSIQYVLSQPDSLDIWLDRGLTYIRAEEYSQAIANFQKVLSSDLANNSILASANRYIGASYELEGNYEEAEAFYTQAMQLYTRMGHDRGIASCGKSLANIYSRKGDFDKAIHLLNQVIDIYQRLPDKIDQVAYAWLDVSTAYDRKGMDQKAKAAIYQANEVKNLGRTAKFHVLSALAGLAWDEGETDLAIRSYEELLAILREEEAYLQQLNCLQSLALLYHHKDSLQDNQEQATSYFEQAFALIPKVYPNPNRREVSQLYLDWGEFFYDNGDYEHGLQAYQKALYHVLAFGTDSTDLLQIPSDSLYYCENVILQALRGKAECLAGLGKPELAVDHYMAMMKAEEKLSACNSYRSSKFLLVGDQHESIGHALTLIEKESLDLDKAFFFFEKSKAQVMNERQQDRRQTVLPDTLGEQLKSLDEEVADLERELLRAGNDTSDHRAQLDSLRFVRSAFQQQLKNRFPSYQQAAEQLSYYPLSDIQKQLRQDQLMIHYVVEDIPYALAISPEGSQMYLLDSLGQHVRSLRTLLEEGPVRSDEAAAKQFASHAYRLYQILLAPLLADFPTASSLIIIPDGPLLRIPFEALLTQEADFSTMTSAMDYDNFWKGKLRVPEGGAAYLLFDYKVQYAFSSGLWRDAPNNLAMHSENIQLYSPTYTDTDSFQHLQIPPLPSALPHAKKVAELFDASDEISGSSQDFLARAHQATYLHLAMHSFVDSIYALRSALAFSQEESGDNALVISADLYAMPPLSARLVSLLACQSGNGRQIQGEGILSLGRAFRLAGAQSVLMSLWDADARLGGLILEEMYAAIQNGQPIVASLREAKIQYLQQAKASEAHPSNWANYVLVGNPDIESDSAWHGWVILGIILVVGIFIGGLLKKK